MESPTPFRVNCLLLFESLSSRRGRAPGLDVPCLGDLPKITMGLDTVEILLSWESTFGIALEDAEVADLRTPQQAIELIACKLGASDDQSFCPAMRAFHVFRSGVRDITGVGQLRIRPSDPLQTFLAGREKQEFWNEFARSTGIEGFHPPQIVFQRATVRDAIELLVVRHLNQLRKPEESWTRSLVRSGVRYGVIHVVGVRDFSDNDRFIEDIGMG